MRQPIALLVLFLLPLSLLQAQSSDNQSLENQLASAPADTLRVRLLNRYVANLGVKQAQSALPYAKEAVQLAEKLFDTRGLIPAYLQMGALRHQLRQPEEAIESYAKALNMSDLFKRNKFSQQARLALGQLWWEQGFLRKSLDYLEPLAEGANAEQDAPMLRKVYPLLLNIYESTNRKRKAREIKDKLDDLLKDLELKQANTQLEASEEVLEELQGSLELGQLQVDSLAELSDSALNMLAVQQAALMKQEAELARLEADKALLAQQKAEADRETAIKDLALERSRTFRNLLIVGGVGLIILVFAVWQRLRMQQQRKVAEIEKQRAERLAQVDRLKDQFLANTSHELRTPLTGIIGISEALYSGLDHFSQTEIQENLSMVIASGKRLNSLVDDILDFSKLKENDLELQQKAVDLRSLAEVILRVSQPLTQGKALDLINAIPKELPAVQGDENRLQQVLHNLVGNAIKFTESGEVRVGAELRQAEGAPEFVEVFIQDTGIGIPAERQEDIFRFFVQADGEADRAYAGTGLGLPISRSLIELHGGNMRVESTEGEGTTFFFTLPLSTEKAQPLAPPPDLVSRPQMASVLDQEGLEIAKPLGASTEKMPHILVVDDEPINQQVLRNHLSEGGYRVTSAMNGAEALAALNNEETFDLVLLDLMMPHMSGFEVCQEIRKTHLPSDLPIIMITAKNQVNDLVKGLAVGANDYISKPFSKGEFLARLRTHLDLNHIHDVTSRFVPTEFLRSLGRESILEVHLGDQQEQEVTVFFSDIRSYTTLAEQMSPAENFRFVHAYARRMGPIIRNQNGFVNQYLGDGIMAIFPRNAEDALKAAIGMQQELTLYNGQRKLQDRPAIKVGMGLHTGPLIMGIIGDYQRMDAATISDTVNTAARMEGLTKHYGANILLSQRSLSQITHQDDYHFRFLGQVQVKGKEKTTAIFECLNGLSEEALSKRLAALEAFDQAVQAYFDKEFHQASQAFRQVLAIDANDLTAQRYLGQALRFAEEGVAENWNGVERLMVK